MAVVIDIQSLLPRITAVGSALDVLASVTDASERVSEPTTPEQQAAMQQVNIERGKLYEDLLTLLVKPHAKRAAEAVALRAVFAQVARCLKDQPLALETLEAYEEDAANSHSDVPRLRGACKVCTPLSRCHLRTIAKLMPSSCRPSICKGKVHHQYCCFIASINAHEGSMSSTFQHRFILTGGPGSGKSTIIDTIMKIGFWCSKEAGRGVIQDQVNIGGNALPWANQTAFSELMLSWEMRSWHEAEGQTQPCFFDRGIPDVVGYLRLSELTIPRHLENAIEKFRYNRTVFIAPPWRDIYVQDTERKQSFDVAVATYHEMVKTYRTYDYQLIELPCVSVEERVDFILSKIVR